MTNCKTFPIKGANIRDLGGFAIDVDCQTSFGKYIRSSLPYVLEKEEFDILVNYGVKKIIDLRYHGLSEEEQALFNKYGDIEYISIPVNLREGSGIDFKDKDFEWGNLFIYVLKHKTYWIKDVIEELGKDEKTTLIHCSCGKDRTGLIAMLLLMIMGVSSNDIAADYSISSIYVRSLNEKILSNLPPYLKCNETANFSHSFFSTDYIHMEKAINYILKNHINIDQYMDYCNVSPSTLTNIRNNFRMNIYG